MAEFLILGASSFYGRNFINLVEERGHVAFGPQHYEPLEDCDYVVNFASKSLVAESWENPEEWVEANALNFSGVIDALRLMEIKRFIHVSTPEVYGSTPNWVDESYTDWKPSTPYAVSRAAGDMMLKAYHRAYGFPAIITRTANIYGAGQQDYRLIPKAIHYKRRGKAFPLEGGGMSRRSFIHVKDACEALYLLCTEGLTGETYHISTREWHYIHDVVKMIGCSTREVEDRLGKDEAYLLDSSKVRELGWSDSVELEEGIRELSQ